MRSLLHWLPSIVCELFVDGHVLLSLIPWRNSQNTPHRGVMTVVRETFLDDTLLGVWVSSTAEFRESDAAESTALPRYLWLWGTHVGTTRTDDEGIASLTAKEATGSLFGIDDDMRDAQWIIFAQNQHTLHLESQETGSRWE